MKKYFVSFISEYESSRTQWFGNEIVDIHPLKWIEAMNDISKSKGVVYKVIFFTEINENDLRIELCKK